MQITTVGLDLAKNILQLHGVDEQGHVVLRKALKRSQVMPFFSPLPPGLIGLEAGGSAHYWARKLQALGHTVPADGAAVRQALGQDQQARCR